MKQPLIIYGNEFHEVESISWLDGEIKTDSFSDKQGVYHTAFDTDSYSDEEGYDKNDLLHLHLDQVVITND